MSGLSKRELKNILRDWHLLLSRLDELRERSKAHCYAITPSYSSTGSCGSGVVSSKVERYYLAKAQIQEELKELERKVLCVLTAISKARLSNKEKMLIESIMHGRSLSSFAKEKNIYISNVYKMRDKAISKIFHAV